MKNILNVVSVYFSIPFFFGNQLSHFKKKGYNPHIICSPSEHIESYAKSQGVRYGEIEIARAISPLKDLIAIYKICKYIRKNKIDMVVGHTPKGALLSMIAATLMGVPERIYFRHGLLYVTQKGLTKRIFIWEERFVSFCATTIVCVSPSLAKLSIDDKLNSPKKQMILGKGTCGGIDTQGKFNPELITTEKQQTLRKQLGIAENAFVVGYSGRIVKDKGIAELVAGFELLKKRFPERELLLLLVGTFEVRDALDEEVVSKITQNPDIIYTGYIKDNIEWYYSLMSMLILPSYREGFGMCVIEASAMKIPILTSRSVGCIDSIIEGQTGQYIEINPESIASGIEKLFDEDVRSRLGNAGRQLVVEHYDNLKLWDEIEQKIYIPAFNK